MNKIRSIAHRGEIAIRVFRAESELGIRTTKIDEASNGVLLATFCPT